MERLTARIDDGAELDEIAFINPQDPEGLYNLRDIVEYSSDEQIYKIADRLALDSGEREVAGTGNKRADFATLRRRCALCEYHNRAFASGKRFTQKAILDVDCLWSRHG